MFKNIPLFLLIVPFLAGCTAAIRDAAPETGDYRPQHGKAESKNVKQSAGTKSVFFFNDFSEGLKTAQREAKPMLVFFYLPDCDNSRRMMETTFCDAGIKQLAQRFVCVRVDGAGTGDYNPKICKNFNVKGFPTTLLLNPQGAEILRLSGRQTPDQLALQMHLTIQTATTRIAAVIR